MSCCMGPTHCGRNWTVRLLQLWNKDPVTWQRRRQREAVVWWITDELCSLSVSLVSGSVISMFVRLPCGGIGVSRNINPVCLFIICASLKEGFWDVSCLWRWTVTLSGMKSTRRAQRVWPPVLWSNSSSKWHQESWRSHLPLSFALSFSVSVSVLFDWRRALCFSPHCRTASLWFGLQDITRRRARQCETHLCVCCHSFLSSFICQ